MANAEDIEEPRMAAGVMMGDMLAFGSLVERSFEVLLVTLLGVVLITHWGQPRAAAGRLAVRGDPPAGRGEHAALHPHRSPPGCADRLVRHPWHR